MSKKIRTLTMYLPQFHRTKENDEWWGEGYTEWTAVRNAKPLFKGHLQPKKPMNGNYYNLLEKETMSWQANLMHTYGIDGQCFYHYYFKDGRKILEKPAENLLEWKDIDMPFCFCWANSSWSRTWSNIKGNSWADKFEGKISSKDIENDGLLLEQKYGREKQWREHLEYLLPFFKDDRYIKVDGRPVFMIYAPTFIYCLSPMIDYWNSIMKKEGLPNIFFIGINSNTWIAKMDALFYNAPHAYWNPKRNSNYSDILTYDYKDIWENIVNKAPFDEGKTYFGGIINCDDTPRRGKNGVCITNFSIDTCLEGLCQLYRKSLALNNEFVFINAWNEWGEGMYLEPDEVYGYKYLECVRQAQKVLETDSGEFVAIYENIHHNSEYKKLEAQWYQASKNARCLDCWMRLKEKGKSVEDYLYKLSVKTVAVYGMGMLGKHLLEELKDSNILIKYIIDQKAETNHLRYKIISPNDEFEEVDAIIITPVWDLDVIYEKVKGKTNARIFSIEEILFECC